jgi:hypothetical protein
MKLNITLTWSKIVAVLILGCAVYLDLKGESKGTIFMFAVPFVVALITGKQVIDRTKNK